MQSILFIHPSNELYGADRSLLRLVRGLDKSSYAPHVVVANDIEYDGLLTAELTQSHIPYTEMNLGVLRRRYQNVTGIGRFAYRTWAAGREIKQYCQKQNIRLIHSNSSAVLAGGFGARSAGVPHVWHIREIITQPTWLNKLIATNLKHYATRVIAVSQPVKDNLVRVQPQLADKCVVIYNGINPTPFFDVNATAVSQMRASWGIKPDDVVVGMVGRISSWKGQGFLLEAIRPLLADQKNVRLVMVGGNVPGEEWRKQDLQKSIRDWGLENLVFIDDFRLDIPAVLAAFDIFVLPSTRPDPFPTVVLEAMATGKPIVATAHGGALEQLDPDKTGFLVSPTDTSEMTAALAQLIQNPQLRKTMGHNAKKRLLKHFTVDVHLQKISHLYESMLGK